MSLHEIVVLLHCEAVDGAGRGDATEVHACFATDLMSEVLAFSSPGALLVTELVNLQAVHTADVAECCAIVFVNGRKPPPEVRDLARERAIPLYATGLTMFEACGLLHDGGIRPAAGA